MPRPMQRMTIGELELILGERDDLRAKLRFFGTECEANEVRAPPKMIVRGKRDGELFDLGSDDGEAIRMLAVLHWRKRIREIECRLEDHGIGSDPEVQKT